MTTSTLVIRATVDKVKSKHDIEIEIEKVWVYVPFPNNIGQLISTEFYSQARDGTQSC